MKSLLQKSPDPARQPLVKAHKVHQVLGKLTKVVTKNISKPFKRSRSRVPVTQNVNHEGASPNQNIGYAKDPSHLHPYNNKHPTMSENSSGCGPTPEGTYVQ
ncbi:uncharacterized protein EDB91DRAFT_1080876 [Suillus paluster]|uniref:uncharacterized protein n=1 Tax=Suillus paluster TaxID=48578 RepID=UPI001B8727F9|nr:uncharacterized protein EDB91DRAFT_1080876 [Suillus paluster]KAG1744065.1 hypothetical protein EDB91DRAFT_1080876 [Suillus paluster]